MDEAQKDQLERLFLQLKEIRAQKHKKFDKINGLARKVFPTFPDMFPRYTWNQKGSRLVHHPNVPGIHPISLEKEHGNRDSLPPRYAKYALDSIEDLLTYIESRLT